MSKEYIFSYVDLITRWQSLTLGKVEPAKLIMGIETHRQYAAWVGAYYSKYGIIRPLMFNGALVEASGVIPEGIVIFVGGASWVKLRDVERCS